VKPRCGGVGMRSSVITVQTHEGLVVSQEWLQLAREYWEEYGPRFLRDPYLRVEFETDVELLTRKERVALQRTKKISKKG
jgi:hypothetical protein